MMDSNIEFKSNVYPVDGYLNEDKKFLSQIYDYVLLKKMDLQYTETEKRQYWTPEQRTIIKEDPICLYAKPDPCWGMVKEGNRLFWKCKCVKTDCEKFPVCRPDFEDTEKIENEVRLFSPLYNECTGYEYEYGSEEEPESKAKVYYPVLYTDADCDYDSDLPTEYKKQNEWEAPEGEYINITDVVKRDNAEKAEEKAEKEEFFKEIETQSVPDSVRETETFHSFSEVVEEEDDLDDDDWFDDDDDDDEEAIVTSDEELPMSEPSENMFDAFKECEQDDIITASVEDVIFVDAGPGTGKTYTLIQRIASLVFKQEADPENIVVLCYTNAAVDEVKDRLLKIVKATKDRKLLKLLNVEVRTFHSFAWWLISQSNECFTEEGWNKIALSDLNFTTSVTTANKAVDSFGEMIFGNWEHFIIDEVQDLTNELGRFVLSMIGQCLKCDCGVTVFGDFCQAIYDYSIKDCKQPFLSEQFYNELFHLMKGKAKYLKLTENRRQKGTLQELHQGLRNAILSKDEKEMKASVGEILDKVEKIDTDEAEFLFNECNKTEENETVCMLFRNNGEVLKASSDLRKLGIPHLLNANEVSRNYAPWITDVFGRFPKEQITKREFKALYKEVNPKSDFKASQVWDALERLMYAENDIFRVKDILRNIGESKIDDPVFRVSHKDRVILSTIHRAKGREYDTVIFDESFAENISEAEEYRVLYVALTRPKQMLRCITYGKKNPVYKEQVYATKRARWVEKNKKRVSYMEFNGKHDIDMTQFVHVDPSDMSEIHVGDAMLLRRKIKNNTAYYELIHEDTEISLGTIQRRYADDIQSRMKIDRAIDMPSEIKNLYVEGIYTEIADKEFLDNHPEVVKAAPNGVWKWINITGMGYLRYDTY